MKPIKPVLKKTLSLLGTSFLVVAAFTTSSQAENIINEANKTIKSKISNIKSDLDLDFTTFGSKDVIPKFLRIFMKPNVSLDDAVANVLKKNFLNPKIDVRGIKSRVYSGKLQDSFSRVFNFYVDDIPLCDYELRAHKLEGFKNPIMLGDIPDLDHVSDGSDWPVWLEAKDLIAKAATKKGIRSREGSVVSREKCYAVRDRELVPVWDVVIEAGGLPYSVKVSDSAVLEFNNRFFDVNGSGTAYDGNPNGNLKTFTLNDLKGNSYLENDYFTTSTTGTKASESSNVFSYSPASNSTTKVTNDGRFDETSLFINANLQYDWFTELGYVWPSDTSKLNIIVHAVIDGGVNNALYTPATGNSAPKIQVGDGDGIRLQNLPKDEDVVSHEFGHHVIFDTLTSVAGESLVIHEGIADYFAFARTHDPCLGESICPAGSPVGCEKEGQCLRSAENNYVLGINTKSEAHLKSQFISGMLWDVRDDAVPADELDQIVFRGIQLLQKSSGYHDLVLAILLADQELYKGEHCPALYKAANDRGLEDYITDMNCDDLPESGFDERNGATTSSSSSSKKKNSSGLPFCGVVTGETSEQTNNHYPAVLAILLPLLFASVRSRRSIRLR